MNELTFNYTITIPDSTVKELKAIIDNIGKQFTSVGEGTLSNASVNIGKELYRREVSKRAIEGMGKSGPKGVGDDMKGVDAGISLTMQALPYIQDPKLYVHEVTPIGKEGLRIGIGHGMLPKIALPRSGRGEFARWNQQFNWYSRSSSYDSYHAFTEDALHIREFGTRMFSKDPAFQYSTPYVRGIGLHAVKGKFHRAQAIIGMVDFLRSNEGESTGKSSIDRVKFARVAELLKGKKFDEAFGLLNPEQRKALREHPEFKAYLEDVQDMEDDDMSMHGMQQRAMEDRVVKMFHQMREKFDDPDIASKPHKWAHSMAKNGMSLLLYHSGVKPMNWFTNEKLEMHMGDFNLIDQGIMKHAVVTFIDRIGQRYGDK